jgi:hypothetical protein
MDEARIEHLTYTSRQQYNFTSLYGVYIIAMFASLVTMHVTIRPVIFAILVSADDSVYCTSIRDVDYHIRH